MTGSNLVERLLSEGAIVRATLHEKAPVIEDDRVDYVRCDLTRADDCRRAVDGVRYVFHCAANTSGAAVIAASPMAHVTPNIVMNSLLLEAAYEARVEKFLYLGSSAAYPPSGDRYVTENELLDGEPHSSYYYAGWMKRFTEILCIMYGEKLPRPMTTIVVRPSNIFGPRDDFEPATSHVTAALVRKVVERHDPIEVWGTGDVVRDVIYIDDMVEGIISAMQKVDSYGAFNIASGNAYTLREILETIVEVDGYEGARIVYDSSKPTTIPIRLIDTSKAEAELGFRARVDLREGLRQTVEWYRKTRGLPRPPAKVRAGG